jgi:zinc protease
MPGKPLSTAYSLFKQALDSFEVRGVTDEDIERFKGGIESQLVNSLQSVSGKVSQLAALQTFTGNPNQIGKFLEMYRNVTKEDVQRVYFQYIKNAHGVTLSIVPKGQEKNVVAEDNHVIDKSKYVAPD